MGDKTTEWKPMKLIQDISNAWEHALRYFLKTASRRGVPGVQIIHG